MARARTRKSSPSSVSCKRRVVRRTSVASSLCSSRVNARLTPETVCCNASAAAVIEPLSITVMNANSSSVVVFIYPLLILSQYLFETNTVSEKVEDADTVCIGSIHMAYPENGHEDFCNWRRWFYRRLDFGASGSRRPSGQRPHPPPGTGGRT